jgi:hypothetical protein
LAQLTVQSAKVSGQAVTFTAASATGDSFTNNGMTLFKVKNGGVSSITVTINSQKQCNYGFDHDISVTVAAGEEKVIGTFPRERFSDDSNNVQITYSDVTSVTVCAISAI